MNFTANSSLISLEGKLAHSLVDVYNKQPFVKSSNNGQNCAHYTLRFYSTQTISLIHWIFVTSENPVEEKPVNRNGSDFFTPIQLTKCLHATIKGNTILNSCSPNEQEAGKESNGDEVEDCREHGLHRRDDEAAMYHKLTQCC